MKLTNSYLLLLILVFFGCQPANDVDPTKIYFDINNIYGLKNKLINESLDFDQGLVYEGHQLFTGQLSFQTDHLSWICSFKDGLIDGSFKEYFGNNQLKSFKVFSLGMENGKQMGFHLNGTKSYEYRMQNGAFSGTKKEFNNKGGQVLESTYENGSVTSNKIWDENGKIIVNYVVKDGRYYGLLGSSNCISVYDPVPKIFSN